MVLRNHSYVLQNHFYRPIGDMVGASNLEGLNLGVGIERGRRRGEEGRKGGGGDGRKEGRRGGKVEKERRRGHE